MHIKRIKRHNFAFNFARSLWAYDGGGGGNGGDNPPEPSEDEKKKLSEAMELVKASGYAVMEQTRLNSLMAKERRDTENKFKAEIVDLQGKLAEAEEAKGKGKSNEDSISKVEHERLLKQAKDESTAKDETISRLQGFQKKNAIVQAAANAGAVKGAYNDIADLLSSRLSLEDDDTFTVLDAKGDKLTGKSGYMTVDELVTGYLAEKPHLKEASTKPGAGSGTTNEGGTKGSDKFEIPAGMEMVSSGQ